jgi:hypothetical protein
MVSDFDCGEFLLLCDCLEKFWKHVFCQCKMWFMSRENMSLACQGEASCLLSLRSKPKAMIAASLVD